MSNNSTHSNTAQLSSDNGVFIVVYDSKFPNPDGTSKPIYLQCKPNGTWTGVSDINQATIFLNFNIASIYAKKLRFGRPRVEYHRLVIHPQCTSAWYANTTPYATAKNYR